MKHVKLFEQYYQEGPTFAKAGSEEWVKAEVEALNAIRKLEQEIQNKVGGFEKYTKDGMNDFVRNVSTPLKQSRAIISEVTTWFDRYNNQGKDPRLR